MRKNKLGITTLIMFLLSILFYFAYEYISGDWKLVFAYMFVIATTLSVCIASVFFHAFLTEGKEFPKAKTGFIISTLASLATAVLSWFTAIKFLSNNTSFISLGVLALALASTVWTFSFIAMLWHYQGELGTDFLSEIRVFVINAIFLGLAFSGIALTFAILAKYDAWNIIITLIILCSYLPVIALSLIGTLIWYLRKARR